MFVYHFDVISVKCVRHLLSCKDQGGISRAQIVLSHAELHETLSLL